MFDDVAQPPTLVDVKSLDLLAVLVPALLFRHRQLPAVLLVSRFVNATTGGTDLERWKKKSRDMQ